MKNLYTGVLVSAIVLMSLMIGSACAEGNQYHYLAVKPSSVITKKDGSKYATTKPAVSNTSPTGASSILPQPKNTLTKTTTTTHQTDLPALKQLDLKPVQPSVNQTASKASQTVPMANKPNKPMVQLSRQDADLLAKMEETLFLQIYGNEDPVTRVERLERVIYGDAVSGNKTMSQRLIAIQSIVLPEAPEAPVQNQPPQYNQPHYGQQQYAQQNNPAPSNVPVASDVTDYPAVTQLESKWFGQTHIKEALPVRLSRLEQTVFQYEQRGSLADRVANLQMVTWGSVGSPQPQGQPQIQTASNSSLTPLGPNNYAAPSPQNGYTQVPPQNYNDPYANMPNNQGYQQAPYGQNTYTQAPYSASQDPQLVGALDDIERQVFKTTFPADPVEIRLSRLESQIFHTTADDLSNDDRLMRVMAVADGNGTDPDKEIRKTKTKKTVQTLLPIILTVALMLL